MSGTVRSIVVGVAVLDGVDSVLPAAIRLAARTGASLHVVHAFEVAGYALARWSGEGGAGGDTLRLYQDGLQARLESQVRALAPACRVFCEAVHGPADRVLARAAERVGADLLIVGATRRGALARAILGTTAQRVLHRAGCPVLVVRPPLTGPVRRVLLATDLSELGEAVHEAGLDVVQAAFGADAPELRALHVGWDDLTLPPELRGGHGPGEAARGLDAFLDGRLPRGRPVEPRVRFGDPAREIVSEAAAWDADLIVVGTHGRTGAARILLGSVAEGALRSALCSVLVIPRQAVAGEAARLPSREARESMRAVS
ncbi:MAG TPA: universal stress protein [Longimicrobiaceae bacterium]